MIREKINSSLIEAQKILVGQKSWEIRGLIRNLIDKDFSIKELLQVIEDIKSVFSREELSNPDSTAYKIIAPLQEITRDRRIS